MIRLDKSAIDQQYWPRGRSVMSRNMAHSNDSDSAEVLLRYEANVVCHLVLKSS